MKKDYANYTAEELLMDDFFITSVRNPTEESDSFWNMQIENDALNREEVELAKHLLLTVQVKKKNMSSEDEQNVWQKIKDTESIQEIKQRQTRRNRYLFSGIAASLLIVIVLSVGLFNRKGTSVSYGKRSEVTLPDGSVVKLNSGSNIDFSWNRKEKIREVKFQGEGYFDVIKDSEPFIVKLANGIQVRVLGTSFNLRAYADEERTQISLVQGKIELVYQDKTQLMADGDIIQYSNVTKEITFVNDRLEDICGWVNDTFYFRDLNFREICNYLEKMYDVKIILAEGLHDERFGGAFYRETDIRTLLDIFSMISKMEYRIDGKKVTIIER